MMQYATARRSRLGRLLIPLAMAQVIALSAVMATTLAQGSVVSGGHAVAAGLPPEPARGALGSSMLTAAASCWEIKQRVPDAADGVYWLVTPTLQRPDAFYCDMTTDGGGWVLIGRGREGWRGEYEGLGTPDQVRQTVTGPEAFTARQLPSKTVDGLLNGGRVDGLDDGIRLRRAADYAGQSWQEVRFQLRNRDRWVWTFRGRHALRSFTFDGVQSPSQVTTLDFGTDAGWRRVNTDTTRAQRWNGGWAYGKDVTGQANATSYIWSAKDGAGNAMPFTQMFLRPKLLSEQLSYPQVPAEGLPASAQRPLAQTRALPTTWGVAGVSGVDGETSELRTEVQAFTQIGSTVYVGGNFETVQRSEAGADQIPQRFLTAFDVHTGQVVPGFRPVFDDQIKALAALPDGRLAVGGEFTKVNGAAAAGFVVLDAATGQRVNDFPLTPIHRSRAPSIRSLKVGTTTQHGVTRTWLYLGGVFTHLRGGAGGDVRTQSAGRVNVADGTPDASWTPIMNGSVNALTPSADGTRVYLAGFFTIGNGVRLDHVAAYPATGPAVPLTWKPRHSVDPVKGKAFQWVVEESASRVWHGGSQHNFYSYDKGTLTYSYGGVALQGGDFQTAVVDGDTVYAGCHCVDYFLSGHRFWYWSTAFDQSDKLGFVGAWDDATGQYLPEFNPIMTARGGYGAWASFVDSTGVLWIGGSFIRAVNVRGTNQWVGGFARYAPRDAQAPAAPTAVEVSGDLGEVELTWTGISEPGVDYEVLENGRVVAVTTGTRAVLRPPAGPVQYVVRAADEAGNRSASTAPVAFDPPGCRR